MKNKHHEYKGGIRRHMDGDGAGRGHPRRKQHGRGRGDGRLFDYGELRLVILAMIAERPQHGYELMKSIEERFGGSYSPSPGVVYPTLAWLNDMGYSAVEAEASGRKLHRLTPEGEAFLKENRDAADELLSRTGAPGQGRDPVPAPVVRAMENLKLALRLRLREKPLDAEAADAIAAAIDAAAGTVERSR